MFKDIQQKWTKQCQSYIFVLSKSLQYCSMCLGVVLEEIRRVQYLLLLSISINIYSDLLINSINFSNDPLLKMQESLPFVLWNYMKFWGGQYFILQLSMGNFQDQFQNIKDDVSNSSERKRIENTVITHRHHSLVRNNIFPAPQPQPSSRVVDHELIHSTVVHRENHLQKSITIKEIQEEEKSESSVNQRLEELDFEFYHKLALLDYEFREIPAEFKREYANLQTVEQKDYHGIKYIGEWKDNLLHGNGVLISNTSKYIGQFRFGLKHFHGRQIFKHEVYEGEFEAGRRKGEGVRYTDESTEVGIFDGHLIYGVIKYVNGNQYKGTLTHNKYHGKGVSNQIEFSNLFNDQYLTEKYIKYANENEDDGKRNIFYEAESETWFQNCSYNLGTLQYAKIRYSNGNIYEGEVQKGCKHGKGKFTWKDGSIYEGEYRWDQKHGKGTLLSRGREYRDKQFINGAMKEDIETVYDDENSEMPAQWL